MTGSTALYLVVPIVMVLAMFGWLGLVFYAGAHPMWKSHVTSGTVVSHPAAQDAPALAGPAAAADGAPARPDAAQRPAVARPAA